MVGNKFRILFKFKECIFFKQSSDSLPCFCCTWFKPFILLITFGSQIFCPRTSLKGQGQRKHIYYKVKLSLPKVKYLYLHWPIFVMKQSRTNSFNFVLSLELVIPVSVLKSQTFQFYVKTKEFPITWKYSNKVFGIV